MVFSSLEFLFAYLTITLLAYYICPMKLRNVVLLIVSLAFYGWGEPRYILLMVVTILADYVFGYFVDRFAAEKKKARAVLAVAVVFNLGILFFFKYADFVLGYLRMIPGLSFLKPIGLSLPIGISFYTFQALSYVIDVYRGDGAVQKNPATFGVYVTLFPQLIAGPIVRYRDVDDQLRFRIHDIDKFASGVRRLIVGLAKKVLFADVAGALWDLLRTGSDTSFSAWLGLICFMFQIYFDFSGYSDMAIGLGRMVGFEFIENFNYPYISKSITEFWRRWHISLGTWFREYLYIPLGGNRVGRWKMYRNIFVVWLFTGLWHGASLNYAIWGLYWFVLLIFEKTFLLRRLEKAPRVLSHAYSLFFILIGWLIFAFEDLSAGTLFARRMIGLDGGAFISQFDIYTVLRNLPFLLILVVACTPLPHRIYERLSQKAAWKTVFTVAGLGAFILSVAYLVSSSYSPFLYLRF